MHVQVHIESEISDNKGSCSRYANYLSKANDFFFNSQRNDIDLKETITMIDEHSKGQLKSEEAKWYAPVYSFSESESRHIAKILFGKDVSDYEDLSEQEQSIYNQKVIDIARKYQDAMALNFDKKDLGICSGEDLMYVGVVENSRTYKGYDKEVQEGYKKCGEPKKGFNTHVHIIQSRKANNSKKSKISPVAKVKSAAIHLKGNSSKMGFDRNVFFETVEKIYDNYLSYDRQLEEKFEFKKIAKLKTVPEDNSVACKKILSDMGLHFPKNNILANLSNDRTQEYEKFKAEIEKSLEKVEKYFKEHQKFREEAKKELHRTSGTSQQTKAPESSKGKYIPKYQIEKILKDLSLHSYFMELEKRGIIQYVGKDEKNFTYKNLKDNKLIYLAVDDTQKWNSFSMKKGGSLISAVQTFEGKSWIDAVHFLKQRWDDQQENLAIIDNYNKEQYAKKKKQWEELKIINDYNKKQYDLREQERIAKQEATVVIDVMGTNFFNKLADNFLKIGIDQKALRFRCKQVKYRNDKGNEYVGVGMQNASGGWTIHNGNFETKSGKDDIIFQAGNKKERVNELLIFENMLDYLHYLKYQNPIFVNDHKEDVIILNGAVNMKRLKEIVAYKRYDKTYIITGKDRLIKEFPEAVDYRERFQPSTKIKK